VKTSFLGGQYGQYCTTTFPILSLPQKTPFWAKRSWKSMQILSNPMSVLIARESPKFPRPKANMGLGTRRWRQILDRKWKYGRFVHAQCIRHNYWNSSLMGQIHVPHFTERISSILNNPHNMLITTLLSTIRWNTTIWECMIHNHHAKVPTGVSSSNSHQNVHARSIVQLTKYPKIVKVGHTPYLLQSSNIVLITSRPLYT